MCVSLFVITPVFSPYYSELILRISASDKSPMWSTALIDLIITAGPVFVINASDEVYANYYK